MSNVFTISESDLASRHSASLLRRNIEAMVAREGRVALDLSVVESVSESYADELFGVLAARHGLPWFFEHVELHAVRESVARTIASAVRYRLAVVNGDDVDASLLAARQVLQGRRAACVA